MHLSMVLITGHQDLERAVADAEHFRAECARNVLSQPGAEDRGWRLYTRLHTDVAEFPSHANFLHPSNVTPWPF